MKNKFYYLIIVSFLTLAVLQQTGFSQNLFRSGIFFHHSTGECIWGPNGSATSVTAEMTRYNTQHGYTWQNAVTLNEFWFPVNYDNEWATWHSIFETGSPESISGYFGSNKIIIVKSCFPSSAIEEIGQPLDTLSPDYKTIYNYKWHWRHIINIMKDHYQNFFVIWTNAPLTQGETTSGSALLSKSFCKWAKDTLARGLDPAFGEFPNNVYVFDFFSKLADANGYLPLQYATGEHDPHPNAQATALVAPLLVNEIFDHSIAYEQVFGIIRLGENIPQKFSLYQNYPNPFNPVTKIIFEVAPGMRSYTQDVKLIIYDIKGARVCVPVDQRLKPGTYQIAWDASGVASGVYFYRLTAGDSERSQSIQTKKMILLK